VPNPNGTTADQPVDANTVGVCPWGDFFRTLFGRSNSAKFSFEQRTLRTSEPTPFIALTGLLKRTARTHGCAERPKFIMSERDIVARVG
jgi:hypothetical protein